MIRSSHDMICVDTKGDDMVILVHFTQRPQRLYLVNEYEKLVKYKK